MDVKAALADALERPDLSTAETIVLLERLRAKGFAIVPRSIFDRLEALTAEMRNVAEGYRAPSPKPRTGLSPAGFRDSVREE